MIRIAALCFFVLVLYTPGTAQDMQRVKATIEELCSKTYKGRGAAHEGDLRASEYLTSTFKTIGLLPVNGSCTQSFQYGINTFPGKMSLRTDKGKLKTGIDYIVKSTCASGKGTYDLYWLDTLVFFSDASLKAFLRKDITQCVIVYPKRFEKYFSERTPDLIGHVYASAGIVELQDKKLTMGLADQTFRKPVFEALTSAFPADAHRISLSVENELITDHTAFNIIGMVPGKKYADSFLVFTAHYDHLGTLGKKVYFPGANDNASGVSMLLELAWHYKANPSDYSIVFIAFAGEESGLLGSSYYVQHPVFPLNGIRFLINLDLLGTGDDGIMVVNGSIFKQAYDTLVQMNEQHHFLPAVKKRGEAANSDHYPFYKKGVPCFFIYTLGGVAAYHDVQDVPGTLPLTRYKEVFALLILFADSHP